MVVDQLPQLGRDRVADLGDARQAAEPRPQLLDRLELGRPGRHPLVVLGGPDGDPRLGGQGGHRVELVGRPVMRLVVVDVEQPEELVTVEERGGAQGVEAFLHDRRPDVVAPRVVAVVDREDRPASGHGGRRQRSWRDPPDGRQVGARQSPAHLDHRVAVLALDEDRRAIALEQDHRMVDQAGQDAVEVEPAADIAGHPPQGLRAVEQMRHLLGALGAADDRTQRLGRHPGDLDVAAAERPAGLADDVQDTPRLMGARDGHRQLRAAVGQDGQGRIARCLAEQHGGHRRATGSTTAGRQLERPADDPERQGEVGEAGGSHLIGIRPGTDRQLALPGLPDRDELMPVGVTDRLRGRLEGIVLIVPGVDPAGERSGDHQVELVALGVEWIGMGRLELDPP